MTSQTDMRSDLIFRVKPHNKNRPAFSSCEPHLRLIVSCKISLNCRYRLAIGYKDTGIHMIAGF